MMVNPSVLFMNVNKEVPKLKRDLTLISNNNEKNLEKIGRYSQQSKNKKI